MNKTKKINTASNQETLLDRANQNIAEQLSPISRRKTPYSIDLERLMDRFKIVIKDE